METLRCKSGVFSAHITQTAILARSPRISILYFSFLRQRGLLFITRPQQYKVPENCSRVSLNCARVAVEVANSPDVSLSKALKSERDKARIIARIVLLFFFVSRLCLTRFVRKFHLHNRAHVFLARQQTPHFVPDILVISYARKSEVYPRID